MYCAIQPYELSVHSGSVWIYFYAYNYFMKLHSTILGEGTPFLILHGFLGMGDNWKTIGKKIADAGYQVHLIDQRNHGRSPHSDAFSYKDMAEDIKQYIEEKKLKNVILLGHSMGGKTAMVFACQYPDEVQKLIVADIGPKYYPQHHQDILDGLDSLDFEVLNSRNAVDEALSVYVPNQGVRLFLMKNLYWKSKGELALRMNLSSLRANVSEIGKELVEEFRYLGETLFLKGQNSKYILKEDHADIKKHFPKATIITIKNAGHWLHAENSEDFLKEVVSFLEK